VKLTVDGGGDSEDIRVSSRGRRLLNKKIFYLKIILKLNKFKCWRAMRTSRSLGWPKCPFLSFAFLCLHLCFLTLPLFSSLLSFTQFFSPLLQFDLRLTRSDGEGEFSLCDWRTLSQSLAVTSASHLFYLV